MLNQKLVISSDANLREALKRLDEGAERILFVVDSSGRFVGTLTDGDARRALLAGLDLGEGIVGIFNPKPIFAPLGEVDQAMLGDAFGLKKLTHVPVVDRHGYLVEVLRPSDHDLVTTQQRVRSDIAVPVIIMAGGKGTRLAPFTNVLPKPLVPIGDKTILELIMEEFALYGARDFRLTLNYRGDMIRAYFTGGERGYGISYVWEKEFFGTAGSIKLVDGLDGDFFVSNCDILVKADFCEVLEFHRSVGAAMTVISSIQHHKVPYGVVDYEPGGKVRGMREKPELSFTINTGVYVLNYSCLEYIPEGQLFNMSDLINILIETGKSVYTFPINEGDYIDVGQWEEYRNAVERLR